MDERIFVSEVRRNAARKQINEIVVEDVHAPRTFKRIIMRFGMLSVFEGRPANVTFSVEFCYKGSKGVQSLGYSTPDVAVAAYNAINIRNRTNDIEMR
ncbi:hypothetical protein EVB87_024 [Rhizobium phage RHph_N28_1]|nr:hypothetical protein EVB87_024 [Rhizobium phage RHph_N28_1]QIG74052.1 hypothetical protein EVC07_024 [Rhizobium phage RHph_N42]